MAHVLSIGQLQLNQTGQLEVKYLPSDLAPCLYPKLYGHVTPKASCVTVNNPTIVKSSQIKANPL